MALVSDPISPRGRVLANGSRLTIAEMKAQVAKLQPPPAKRMEEVYAKYRAEMIAQGLSEIRVDEPDINWRALVLALPKPQPTQVLGTGYRKVWLKEYSCVYDGQFRFHLERLDGTFAAFNFKQAYRDRYHRYFDKSFSFDVEMALRAAVLPHLIAYKEAQRELTSNWSGRALRWEHAAVQHYPVGFREIVASFLDHLQISMDTVKLDYDPTHVFVLRDKELEKEWVHFHALRANYRILGVDEGMREADL
jgi:hypothetical protein